MEFTFKLITQLFLTMMCAAVITPIVKLLAFQIGAVDMPNARRINTKPMPTAGGLAIFITFTLSTIWEFRSNLLDTSVVPILLGALIVVITGLIDDIRELKPLPKLIGLILAGLEIYYVAGIRINTISIPFIGMFDLHWLSLPVTLLWILTITNAVNLIDGLDGLATGVSMIALITIGLVSYFYLPDNGVFISIMIFTLVASMMGFFPYNFNPASIYLGDTGALMLGFFIAVFSLQGLKNVTFISVLTPMFILGVPITDTIYAIIRRLFNKQKISSPDRMHLHHRLISLGFSHRGAVMTIYALAMIFSFIALLMNYASTMAIILLVIMTTLGLELFIELIGLVGENRQPLMHFFQFFGNQQFRHERLAKWSKRFKKNQK